MFRMEENTKDDALLGKLHLEPLAIDIMADESLVKMIQAHNARLVKLRDRIDALVAHRERLADPTNWLDFDSAAIRAARCQAQAEGWDILLGLREALGERRQVLVHVEEDLQDRRRAMAHALDKAIAKAEKALAGERRELLRSNPARAEAHFRDLVNADVNVDAAAARLHEADAAITHTQDARRRAQSDQSTVAFRQREVFATLVR